MRCEELRAMLPAYLDGELDVGETLAVERHLAACPECAGIASRERAFRAAFRDSGLRSAAPDALRARVDAAVRKQARLARPARGLSRAWMAAAASLVLGAALGVLAARLARAPVGEGVLAEEALSAHLRSLIGDHLTDVGSSDRHTVKPWFAGKLDYSPPVVDLAAEGFPLVGGRIDVLHGRPVAALVYRRHLHVISVFVRPGSLPPEAPRVSTEANGYHLARWTDRGMDFCAVSDLEAGELRRFADLLASSE